MSIHPGYAQAIMDGHKRVEFRKQPFAQDVSHIVVYATAPVQRIVGMMGVEACDVASPDELWRRYRHVGAITKCDFDGYYDRRSEGVAIQLEGDPLKLDLPLSALGHDRPPQSFAYLDDGVAAALRLSWMSDARESQRVVPSLVRRLTSAIRKVALT